MLDQNGVPIVGEQGEITLRNESSKAEFMTERAKLLKEIAEIEGGAYTSHLNKFEVLFCRWTMN